ncbi:MAG: gamma-glutamylcyclotransferase family protein [Aestuariibacter sp.]
MNSSQPFFVYGTLTHPEIREVLFNQVVEAQPATLLGWQRRMADDGYLFIVPDANSEVKGQIIALNQRQIALADMWEDVTRYHLETVNVQVTSGQAISAQTYTRAATVSGNRVEDNCIANHSISEIVAAITALHSQQ